MRIELSGILRQLALVFHRDPQRSFSLKRNSPCDHLIQDNPQGIDIRTLVDFLHFRLLWGHVFRCSDHNSRTRYSFCFERASYPEIHDPRIPFFIDHDVLGFEIAVHDSQAVCFCQSLAYLFRNEKCFPRSQGPHPSDRAL